MIGRADADIRPLGVADAEAFANLFVQIWQETYANSMPAEKLDALDARNVADRFRGLLQDPEYPTTVGAFSATGELIGWARAAAPRDADYPCDFELWSLNVAPGNRGTGLARRLMNHVLSGRSAYLWVVEGNQRAIRFYEREGFHLDGGRKWDEIDEAFELRMVRSCVSEAGPA